MSTMIESGLWLVIAYLELSTLGQDPVIGTSGRIRETEYLLLGQVQ